MSAHQATATQPGRQAQGLKERGAQATKAIHNVLHLPAGRNDTTLLRTAIDEVIGVEIRHNEQIAVAIRNRYDELTRLHGTSAKRAGRTQLEPLVPFGTVVRIWIHLRLPIRKS